MALGTLIPPCYNDGDNIQFVQLNTDTNLRTLEMLARLSGMTGEGNVYCSYDKNANEGLIFILDNTIEALTPRLLEIIGECTGKIVVKGRIKDSFQFTGDKLAKSLNPLRKIGINANSIDLRELDMSNVTSCAHMFFEAVNLTEILFNDSFTANNVTNMSYMFSCCGNLENVPIQNFVTNNVTDMSHMFSDCSKLENVPVQNFDTSNVTNMSYMFTRCKSLKDLILSNFDTSNVISMVHMFNGCASLTNLDLHNFDTRKVETMSHMFFNCACLKNVVLSSFDTSNVTDMSSMFAGCEKLTNLTLDNFNTSNVTDMSSMFHSCISLDKSPVSTFDTHSVKTMATMFHGTTIKSTLDLNHFDTTSLEDITYMFCSLKADKLLLSKFSTSKITFMSGLFIYAELNELDIRNYSTDAINYADVSDFFDYTKINVINMSNARLYLHNNTLFRNAKINKIIIAKNNEQLLNYIKKNTQIQVELV